MRNKIKDNPNKGLSFLYNNAAGRILLRPIVTSKIISNIVGFFMETKLSTIMIKRFIKNNHINMDEYEEKKYKSFNDFFIRNVKDNKRVLNDAKNEFISPCDSKLSVYNITEDLTFKVKGSTYSVDSILKNDKLAKEYKEGLVLLFRLSPEDYHRYFFIDDCIIKNHYKLKGKYNTVNPIVYDKFKVFKENSREVSVLKTKNFDDIVYIEVGALLVGKIINYDVNGNIKRGEEKGYFKFGGSTVILLVKKDIVKIDKEIIDNTKNGYETCVKCKEKIGKKYKYKL